MAQLCWVNLDGLGVFKVTGDDADTFLQGQLTCDIEQLKGGKHCLAAYLTPQGKTLALFRMFRDDKATYCVLPKTLIAPTLQRLKMYVMMSNVELTDLSDEWPLYGLIAADGQPVANVSDGEVMAVEQGAWLGFGSRALYVGSRQDEALILSEQAITDVDKGSESDWIQADIRTGIPNIYSQTRDAFIPQMLNLDCLGGISFKKGCYTGQEIVARTHYRGRLKRRLFVATVSATEIPQPGDDLYSLLDETGQSVGKIVDAVSQQNGECLVSCVLKIDQQSKGQIVLQKEAKETLKFLDLPYPLELPENQ